MSVGIIGVAWGRGIYLNPKTGRIKSLSTKEGIGFTYSVDIEIKEVIDQIEQK